MELNRRITTKLSLHLSVLLLILISACSHNLNEKGEDSKSKYKTNVVFILIDDLSHLGVTAYGADRISSNQGYFENVKFETTHIDKLAEQGLLCQNAFAHPLCEPTRIALMSGKHNNRNFLKCKAQHASDITFGDVFQKAGYATGIFGKWKQSRGTNEIPGEKYIYEFGWDEFACFDVTLEGQRFINPNLVINGEIRNFNGRTDLDPTTGRRWYGPDICNRHALNFIETHKDEPFFLYYPMLLVHDDHKPTPDTKPMSLFDNFDEANHNRDGHTGDDPKYFPDMISYMDELIGNVVSKLDEHGLRERTLIIVMGDNGTKEIFTHVYANGELYPARKGGTSDNGIHVPLILSQPNKIPNDSNQKYRVYDGLVDVSDIFPTMLEATGIEIAHQERLDGISFWPQVMGEQQEHREYIYSWYNGNDSYNKTDLLLQYAFNKEFKYYAPDEDYPEGRFFDLRTDIFERSGTSFKERRWGVRLYEGLDESMLTTDQKTGYDTLKAITKRYLYIPVSDIRVESHRNEFRVGETFRLEHEIIPENATRNNVIWHTDDPDVVTVDKFGELKAIREGEATIRLFSWDDAIPVASNSTNTFLTDGIQDSMKVIVK